MDQEHIGDAERLLGYRFNNRELLHSALTHASLVDSRLESNERLEFLGDAVLGMVVCEYLFNQYGDLLEGDMTKIKSSVVSRRVCAKIAYEMGLDDLLRLGKGMSNRESLPGSVVAAVLEALIGAIYLDSDLPTVREFILVWLRPWIKEAARSDHQSNFKSVLQQCAQQDLGVMPRYIVLDEKGPDHAKCFEVCVELGAQRFDSCWGPSKKEAEQDAALNALVELGWVKRLDNGNIELLKSNLDECDPEPSSRTD